VGFNERFAILFGALALLARVGMAWYTTGLSRSKNAAAAILRNVLDFCIATLAFWAFGAAIMSADVGLYFDHAGHVNFRVFLHLVLVLFASAIPVGAGGERSKLLPMAMVSFFMASLVVPLAGYFAWMGWLARMDYIDEAGASVVHLAAGVSALAVAILVGPRSGKYNRDGSSNMIPGHSLPMASVGVILMLVAWGPYVIGAGALHSGAGTYAAFNVLLAAAAGGLAALIGSIIRYGKPDVALIYSGLLGALVAVTGAANLMPTGGAVAIGVIAGAIVPWALVQIDLRFKVDDPAGAIAIHGIGGLIGTLAVAFVAPIMTMGQRMRQLGVQALGVVLISVIALASIVPLLFVLKKAIGIRAREADEFDGLDLAEHDLNAYPDFQQTTIKSYHLREA
jgi:Amt family ammonium transporter